MCLGFISDRVSELYFTERVLVSVLREYRYSSNIEKEETTYTLAWLDYIDLPMACESKKLLTSF
jgi:hypothetical protein